MKTKTVSPTPSTDNAFLRIAIHRSPRQPRQTPPLLLDNPRRRTPTTPATLQSRRRTAEATSEDRRRSSCDSDSTQSSSRCLRPPPRGGEDEFDGERTRGLPLRPGFGRGEPLLRRLAVGVGGETLTGATAGTGTADSGSDSGGGEVKAGLGDTSSSSGGRRFESRPYRNIRICRTGRGYRDGGSQWRRRRCRRRLLHFQWKGRGDVNRPREWRGRCR